MITPFMAAAIAGVLCAANCALLGSYLVLRRMSLIGDAISHAVLPGLVLGWMITQSQDVAPMFLGALAAGVVTAVLVEFLRRVGGVSEDASLGTVFTMLFALGVLLINNGNAGKDLDPGCVLYGTIESTYWKHLVTGGVTVDGHLVGSVNWGLRAFWILGATLGLTVVFVLTFYKELLICSFDPQLAKTQGYRPMLMHYLLMLIVALATVAAFESVGSILVVAMLIVPAAAAHLLTDRMWQMQLTAVAIAVAAALLGAWSGEALNVTMAGMMAVWAGAILFGAALFSPRHGILAKQLKRWALQMRIYREDVLGILYRLEEQRKTELATVGRVKSWAGGGWGQFAALWILQRRGLVAQEGDRLTLTDSGRKNAQGLVRGHRLWELLMVNELGYRPTAVHAESDQVEHFLSPAVRRELNDLPHTETDPHGKDIPHP